MQVYNAKSGIISGTSYREVYKKAQENFKYIKSRTKRKPYIRSAYFNKQKIFFDFFWAHLMQKHEKDRTRRLRFFTVAIELIINTRFSPTSHVNPNKSSELMHRFYGKTRDDITFVVQIKESLKTHRKQFMSVFPYK